MAAKKLANSEPTVADAQETTGSGIYFGRAGGSLASHRAAKQSAGSHLDAMHDVPLPIAMGRSRLKVECAQPAGERAHRI
jgi:hypothetical protein